VRGLGVIAAAVGALALIAVGAAAGAGGITIVKKTTTTNGGPSSRTAHCPSKDHVLGGGFSAPLNPPNIAQVSAPRGDDSWTAGTLTSPPSGHVSSYAICERASQRKLQLVTKAVRVPAAMPDTVEKAVKAKCAKGWEVVSGGYEVKPTFDGSGHGQISVDTSMRTTSRVWKVHGGNGGKPTKLIAYALCQKAAHSHIDQIEDTPPNAGVEEATAECPQGSHIVGGGFKMSPDASQGNPPQVNASMPAGAHAWKAVGEPAIPGPLLTAFAECES
jgi:hypothetical protein